jgi:hypothetical protein
MEKEKFAQGCRLLLTSKNQRTSIRCNTDPKSFARFGRGETTAVVVGEGLMQRIKIMKLDTCRNPLIRPDCHFLPNEERKE